LFVCLFGVVLSQIQTDISHSNTDNGDNDAAVTPLSTAATTFAVVDYHLAITIADRFTIVRSIIVEVSSSLFVIRSKSPTRQRWIDAQD
jgi:hypothetical protein